MTIHKAGIFPFDTVLASFTECKLAVEDQQKLHVNTNNFVIINRQFLLCKRNIQIINNF